MKILFILFFSLVMQQSYSQQYKKVTGAKASAKKLVSKTSAKQNLKPPVAHAVVPKKAINKIKPALVKTNVPIQAKPNNPVEANATLTAREKEMIDEINTLRSNPSGYCTYVKNFLEKNDIDEDTKTAAKELVDELKKMKPLTPLSVNPIMYSDAKQYGQIMARRNIFEHSELPYSENLSIGYQNIRDAIVDLLIDSDIPGRGHRKNLLNERIKYVAVYELPGKVQDIAWCYVQEFK